MLAAAYPQSPVDRLLALTPAMRAAHDRVAWPHYQTLRALGVPAHDLVRDACFTFGIVTIHGREMIVTEDARLRAYLTGPVIASMPALSAPQ